MTGSTPSDRGGSAPSDRGGSSGSGAGRPAPPRPMPRADAQARAMLLKAVADPVRLQLLDVIRRSPGHEACVADLTEVVGVSQPTVSHHLKVLGGAGLLTRERRGTWAWFALAPEGFDDLRRIFDVPD